MGQIEEIMAKMRETEPSPWYVPEEREDKRLRLKRDKEEQIAAERKRLAAEFFAKQRTSGEIGSGELAYQEMLLREAKWHNTFIVRKDAAIGLTDQRLLAQFLQFEHRPQLYHIAGDKLIDPDAIIDAVRNAKYCRAFLVNEKVTDQQLLAELARTDPQNEVRIAAIRKILDEQLLIELARTDPQEEIRLAALDEIYDEQAIVEIAKNNSSWEMRFRAYARTEEYCPKINASMERMLYDESSEYRKAAATRLIELLKADQFAAHTFWSDMARISEKEHVDEIVTVNREDDCGHEDYTRHADRGIGLRFPAYPFDD